MRISVIGGSDPAPGIAQTAEELGKELGKRNHTVVCGGLTGVMHGVCKGVQESNGESIGILPGTDPDTANEYVSTAIPTGLGHARNVLVVMNGEGVIAVNGEAGTLSEIGIALDLEKPIAGLNTFSITGIEHVDSPKAAVEYIEQTADPIFR